MSVETRKSTFGFAFPAVLDVSKVHGLKPVKVLSESPRSMVIVCEPNTLKWSKKLAVLTKKDVPEESCVLKSGFVRGYIEKEAACLNAIGPHPNIVQMMDYFYSGDSVFSVLEEKVPGDSVVNLVMAGGPLKEPEAALIVSQVAKALAHLHAHSFVHRDVKPDNIIYDRVSGVAKLIDFEFADNYSKGLSGSKGTGLYLAPEVRRGRGFFKGPEIDVWALTISLYVMLCAAFPFTETQIDVGFPQLSPKQTSTFSVGLRDLFHQGLHLQPSQRPSVLIFETHPWIRRCLRSEALTSITNKLSKAKKESRLSN